MYAARKAVIKEPVVDLVDSMNLVSTTSPIFDIDLQRVNQSQLSFVSSFSLQFIKRDYIHALVA